MKNIPDDLNLVDKKKESTALILASKYLRVEVARALVQAGASLTYRDVNKLTAFAWAEEKEGEDGKDSESVAIQNILLPMQHTHVTDANDVFASGDAAALEDELLARTTTKAHPSPRRASMASASCTIEVKIALARTISTTRRGSPPEGGQAGSGRVV